MKQFAACFSRFIRYGKLSGQILFILFFFLLFTGYVGHAGTRSVTPSVIPVTGVSICHEDPIRFDFSATANANRIDIRAILYNDSPDTVYFLSTSCNGIQYSLVYDSTALELTPFLLCNASWPIIVKIPPHDKIEFTVYFRVKEKRSSLKLGFDFNEIPKTFDLSKATLYGVHHRDPKDRYIKWVEVKPIN